jgi:mannose PTS system EIID component
MLLRSFAIQGSWNYETLIGTGFAFTILPALRWLYGDESEEFRGAVARHSELFNSHPYLATVAVGAVCRLEAEGIEPAVVHRFKTALRGSLGSIGDRLVWGSWRPASVLLGFVLLVTGVTWWVALIAFLIVYNTLHITLRVAGLQIGAAAGLDVGRLLRESRLQAVGVRSSQFGSLLLGAALILWIGLGAGLLEATAARPDVAVMAGAGVAVIIGYWLGMRARRVLAFLLAGVAALGIIIGSIGYGS